MIEIVMFTKDNCPNCNRADMLFQFCPVEIELHKLNVSPTNENGGLRESNIDKGTWYSPEEAMGILKDNDIMSVPSFKINGKWIEGFNEGKIKEELGL